MAAFFFAACTTLAARRSPRTGVRATKTHPTPSTGLPPTSRPLSNSHGYSPWSSWNESFEKNVGVGLSATCEDERVAATDGSRRRRDDLAGEDRLLVGVALARRRCGGRKVASTTTVMRVPGYSSRKARTASSSWARLGSGPALGGDVGAVDDDVVTMIAMSGRQSSTLMRALVRRDAVRSRTVRPMAMRADDDPTAEVTDLLQHLIRNACVNDGTVGSGDEARTVDVLAPYLEGRGRRPRALRAAPGRGSLVARIEGTDPTAPTLLLLGPHRRRARSTRTRWQRDPFGGELSTAEVWGRGAVDMLNLTASMAVAFRRLAAAGSGPEGTLVSSPSPTRRRRAPGAPSTSPSTSSTRCAATTSSPSRAAFPIARPTGTKLPVIVGEKGCYWCTLTRHGHARPRLAAVPHRQRAGEGGRGRAPHRRATGPEAQIGRHLAAVPRRRWTCPTR